MVSGLMFMVLGVGSATAQTSGETFKAGVTMIQVPVVVRDRNGTVVANLGKDDFQIFDNGKRQEIASFSVESAGGSVAPDRSVTGGQGSAAAVIPSRFIAYFFDDVRIQDFGDLKRIKEAAAEAMGALQPGDRAGIVTSSCSLQQDFTDDRGKLRDAVTRLQLHPPAVCRFSQTQTREVELLKGVVSTMAKLPGRRDIVLLSSGFFIGPQRPTEESELIEAAIRAKVAISSVDLGESTGLTGGAGADGGSAGMGSGRRNANPSNPVVLVDLARGTGGTYVTGNDFGVSLRKMATAETHYLLGFAPSKADGKFHQLKVKLEGSRKATVEARNGYYAARNE